MLPQLFKQIVWVPGFESNAGIKTPCLTAWRHPTWQVFQKLLKIVKSFLYLYGERDFCVLFVKETQPAILLLVL